MEIIWTAAPSWKDATVIEGETFDALISGGNSAIYATAVPRSAAALPDAAEIAGPVIGRNIHDAIRLCVETACLRGASPDALTLRWNVDEGKVLLFDGISRFSNVCIDISEDAIGWPPLAKQWNAKIKNGI